MNEGFTHFIRRPGRGLLAGPARAMGGQSGNSEETASTSLALVLTLLLIIGLVFYGREAASAQRSRGRRLLGFSPEKIDAFD